MARRNDWQGIGDDERFNVLLDFLTVQGFQHMSGKELRRVIKSKVANSIVNLVQRLNAVVLNSEERSDTVVIEMTTSILASKIDLCTKQGELRQNFEALRNLGFVLAFAAPMNLVNQVDRYESILTEKGFQPIRTQGVIPGSEMSLQVTDLWVSKIELAQMFESPEPNRMRTYTIAPLLRQWVEERGEQDEIT